MSNGLIKTGGGTFDPAEQRVYFIASNVERMKYGATNHTHLLMALNEIVTDEQINWVDTWLTQGKKVFIDSGVYDLAVNYAKTHGITMDVALNTNPQDMEEFDTLFKRYTSIVKRFEERLWGYIEIDLGGRDNKIKTRARLESMGFKPIPVYHPLNDGWDYFDYLAERYDRVCFGNLVYADPPTRKRLLATMWERHRKYPHLWVHLLGLTPNHIMNAYPSNSADSSAWLSSVRWSGYKERVLGASFGGLPLNFQSQMGAAGGADVGHQKAVKMSGYGSYMIQRNWRNHISALEQHGIEVYHD